MTAGTYPVTPDLRAALDAARVVFGAYDRAPVADLWQASQTLLQQVLQRPELRGQALVGEARRLGRLALPDAHALIELHALADRSAGAAASEAERILVREAWMALQHAVPHEAFEPLASPRSSFAPPLADAAVGGARHTPPPPPGTPLLREPASLGRAPNPAVPSPGASATSASTTAAAASPSLGAPARRGPSGRRLGLLIGAAVALVAIVAGAAWWITTGRDASLYETGVAAYQRGAREVARSAFVELAQRQPSDARPLVYLGRMSREDADLARARRFLTTAVRVAPGSALAQRELASLMLADGQPEIARRFYVHALELDPADRVAQGFLGCALYRLQRYEEAQRWVSRAGPGDWQRCVGPVPVPGSVPGSMPGAAPLPPTPMPPR